MRKQYNILIALGVLIMFGWMAHYFNNPAVKYAGLSCSDHQVATFGWTNKDRARAELAAILRWKIEAEKLGLGAAYGEWHHAQKRFLQCRRIGGPTGQFQCKVSAMPCRPEKKGEKGTGV